MSRPLRLDHAGALWHVTSRGNERKDIFRDDVDRQRWMDLLGRTADTYSWRIHAYVQMGNHFHIVVETPEPTLSLGMRQLNGVYAQWFNRRHDRVGHLFQGRFHAFLVDREPYLLEVVRYVVQNPVRAGMVRRAADWRWSSHRAMAGMIPAPSWLDTSVLVHFGRSRRRYSEFVAESNPSFKPSQLCGRGIALGNERFRRELGEMALTVAPDPEIPRAHRLPEPMRIDDLMPRLTSRLDVTRDELARPRHDCAKRAMVAWGLKRYCRAMGKALAPLLGVTHWQAARLARRGRQAWQDAGLTGIPD
jgi:putative transposase